MCVGLRMRAHHYKCLHIVKTQRISKFACTTTTMWSVRFCYLILGYLCFYSANGRNVRRDPASDYNSEKDYYDMASDYVETLPPESSGGRPGNATDTHTCDSVRGVPSNLRSSAHMYPQGLTSFYQKYTEAYGIPVVSSRLVSDSALRRACYTVRFMFADVYAIRNSFYKRYGRFAIIGVNEGTTSIPEHSWLPDWWNQRARGLGATDRQPVSTAGEENALCYNYPQDRYRREDIVMHEYAHGFHLLGAKYAITRFENRLQSLFNDARRKGLWANTYAQTDIREYFAEGFQSYFNAEAYANPPDGIHNHVNTRDKLREYDAGLYKLINEVFPCGNVYIQRCDKNRNAESAQNLRMNCDGNGGGGGGGGGGDGGGDGDGGEGETDCEDTNERCSYWAGRGECEKNPDWMLENCKLSCDVCDDDDGDDSEEEGEEGDCEDDNTRCAEWARAGECARNPGYMLVNCQRSCDVCSDGEGEDCVDTGNYCDYWSTVGYCNHAQHREYMSQNCKQSCSLC